MHGESAAITSWSSIPDVNALMAILFRTDAAPLGKTVVCTVKQWSKHVVVHHPILIGHEADVEDAAHDPDIITRDTGHANRRGFYKLNVNLDPLTPHLKVVVEFPLIGRAEVVTAYETNRVKAGEVRVWQR